MMSYRTREICQSAITELDIDSIKAMGKVVKHLKDHTWWQC